MLYKISPTMLFSLLTLMTAGSPSSVEAAQSASFFAQPFPLGDVRLLDSPFKENRERNAAYLLSLEPDRLLHNARKYAGLAPKGELYGGWEAQGIAGHTLGHYLTAISLQYAATGDKRFRDRIDYAIKEMAECQKAYGDGYIGALMPKELATMRGFKQGKIEPENNFFFKGGGWVPWYTQHKVLAGLKDAWVFGGSAQAKEVTLKLADWVDSITKDLTPDQQQKMLQVEHGGMLETLMEIYVLTGEQRYLDVSRRFYHRAILDPLGEGKDELTGKHANTQIPKVIGVACIYEATGDEKARKLAQFFWDTVVHRRSYVIGANSDHEHFFPVGKMHEHLGPQAAETCNTYNMLKLTEHLFTWEPSVELADYYERSLYNHILASQEPKKGMFTYYVSLKPGHFKTYSSPFDSFWCCVGTGMENHTKYGEAIYFHGKDRLYLNLFIPSALTWKEKGFALEQHTNYPNEDFTELTIQTAPATPLTLLVRCPAWTAGPVTFQLNDKPLDVKSQPGQYAEISRIWVKGDRLRVSIPLGLRVEKMEGDPKKVAYLYGPLVLAGDLGPVPETKTFPYAPLDQTINFRSLAADVPKLVRADDQADLAAAIKRIPGPELAFRTEGLGQPAEVTLKPFNRIFYGYYNIYWDVLSQEEWKSRQAELKATKDRQTTEEARIVDEVNFGEQQSEVDHRVTSERSRTGDFAERKWRHAEDGGYFEFQIKVLRGTPQVLRCTYWGDDAGNRRFDILINGKVLQTQKLDRNRPGQFFNIEYPIPTGLLGSSDKATVRFKPHAGNVAGGVFNCAVLKVAR